MEDRQAPRLISHDEVECFLRKFGYSPERVRDVLRDLPDPVDIDRAREVASKHGITIGGLIDRMGGSP
jgi:hypothetical protein